MRIVKIELQNINSLKSEQPIVVDFESERFKNVGLFAITGPTGAGKTTLLDAITIGLYHSVPRFNQSHVKAGLEDVVSYGAEHSMCRITFVAKEERYEAFWSIRLTGRGGRKLTTPREDVRLKNLTKGLILSEKKRELVEKVKEITHLDYGQFLRSALLAQGEFAAFLSAKVDEKGKLLEQITGQDIYKRIGNYIGDSVGRELKKLDKIKAEVNDKDTLSQEEANALKEEQKTLEPKISALQIRIKDSTEKLQVFKQIEELESNKEAYQKDIQLWLQEKENAKQKLEALALHQKAEPFKADLDKIAQLEKKLESSESKKEESSKKVETIKPLLEKQESVFSEQMAKEEIAKQDQQNWAPKLEKVAALDATVEKHNSTQNQLINEKRKFDEILSRLHSEHDNLISEKSKIEASLSQSKSHFEANKWLIKADEKLPLWSAIASKWTQLHKQNSNDSLKLSDLIKQFESDEKQQSDLSLDVKKASQLFDEKSIALDKAKDELKTTELNLIEEKIDTLNTERQQLTDLLNLSGQYLKTDDRRKKGESFLGQQNAEIEAKQKELITLNTEIEKAEILLKDAQTIVDLEAKVKAFEEERNKLQEGEACPLCGSDSHPLVHDYSPQRLSESEQVLQARKEAHRILDKQYRTIEASKSKLEGKSETAKKEVSNILMELKSLSESFEDIKSTYQILAFERIKTQADKVDTDIQRLNTQLKKAKLKQHKVEELTNGLAKEKDTVAAKNKSLAVLQERIQNASKSITELSEKINLTKIEISGFEEQLNAELSQVSIELPDVEYIQPLIQDIAEKIERFKKNKETLQKLEKDSVKNTELRKANFDSLKEKEDQNKAKTTEILEIKNSISELKIERQSILPNSISIEQKRNGLQKTLNTLSENCKILEKDIQGKTSEIKSLNDYINTLKKEDTSDTKELYEVNKQLTIKLTDSVFEDKANLNDALLSIEEYESYKTISKRIDDEEIRLKSVEKINLERRDKLQQNLTFSETKEELTTLSNSINSEKDKLVQRQGEIKSLFDTDKQIKDRNKTVFDRIANQEKQVTKWKSLLELLGGSKDAFNRYVQRLTLQNLIQLANVHLYKLNSRYSLEMNKGYKAGEELNFSLIDHYQTHRARPVDTSSGGEKFLISLSLALGLSDLASNNVKIESLFIDEGFGTLDSNALEVVLSTLETLQAQGKMIGVISHVENLKDRISTQIQVHKKSSGVSVVEIV